MITKIQKWGNSQGLRIPKDILEQASIIIGEDVDVSVRRGEIVVKPAARIRGKYKDIVAHIPKTYKSAEENWGQSAGKEVYF